MAARALALATLAAAAPTQAADTSRVQSLQLDPARSSAEFEVKVLWLVGVHGRFPNVHGSIAIDHFRNSATVDARIDTNRVTMRNKGHEDWVKSAEFFDAAQFPEIHFVSEPIPLQRLQGGGEIDGTLTLRGISRPVQFELTAPTCPGSSGEDCPLEAEGSIRRSEFGMRSRHGTLADRVDLTFTIFVVPPPG